MWIALRQRARPSNPGGVAFCGYGLSQARAFRRLQPAFLRMRGSVDDLQIRGAPICQQCRPSLSRLRAASPDLEQRHAVIDLGVLAEPRTRGGTAMVLQTPQMPHVIARRRPQLPGHDAAGMPRRIPVRTLIAPQIAMPAEAEHRLPAHAAIARASGVDLFAKRRRRRTKTERTR